MINRYFLPILFLAGAIILQAQLVTTNYFNVHNTVGPGIPDLHVMDLTMDQNILVVSTEMGGVGLLKDGLWDKITPDQGLPNEIIYKTFVDDAGQYWILTERDLFLRSASGLSLIDEVTMPRCVESDHNGNIWFGTNTHGLWKYSSTGEWTRYLTDDGLIQNNVLCLFEDHLNRLWIGTYGGVSMYDGYTFTNYTTDNGLTRNAIYEIGEDDIGRIWMATWSNGIDVFDGTNWENQWVRFVRDMYMDSSDTLWIVSNDVVYSYKNGIVTEEFAYYDFPIEPITFTSFQKDTEGNIYTGTYHRGLLVYRPGIGWETMEPDLGLITNYVDRIAQDDEGRRFFGGSRGLSILDNGSWTNFSYKRPFGGENIMDIYKDASGHMWVSVGVYLYEFDGIDYTEWILDDDFIGEWVYSIFQDDDGNYWFGTNGGVFKWDRTVLTHYTISDGLFDNDIIDIDQDSDGNIWIANEYAMNRFDGSSFTVFPGGSNGLSDEVIYEILASSNGDVWVGTFSGLSRWDGTGWTTYNSGNSGLNSNRIWSLIEDATGAVWVGTRLGLNRFDGANFTAYREENGLQIDEHLAELYFDSDGSLWVGTFNDGAFSLDVSARVKEQAVIKDMIIQPNPANDYIMISTQEDGGKYHLQISDVRGSAIVDQSGYLVSQEWLNLDINGFTSGIYIINIVMNQKLYTQKMIVTE